MSCVASGPYRSKARRGACAGLLLALVCSATQVNADEATLDPVIVTAWPDAGDRTANSASEGTVSARQLENRPLLRPAEVLEAVPGLAISQHSGDGKANQYYLRGFNLDHGTDFALSVMGMPVNLPSHAHGQGYSDLQFLIPELVEQVRFRKGPYAADVGDFATAGSANIDYVRRLESSLAQITVGQNGYQRSLLSGSPSITNGHLLYALEWTSNDGPWVVPERLGKLNGLLRYSEGNRDNGWSVGLMAYRADWISTDQVPVRAIDSGLIPRLGSLDPTDGGQTHRNSLSGEWSARDTDTWTRGKAWMIDYSLDLWSNFTFCTLGCNPGPGDQFQQTDRRKVYGAETARTWYTDWSGRATDYTLGMQSRFDDIGRIGLYTTTARQIWGTVREDAVQEGSFAVYGEQQIQWFDHLRSVTGLRADFYRFDVRSDRTVNSGQATDHLASPKLALVFGPWDRTEYYVNAGRGFHSNDARGITTRINPDYRDPNYLGTVAAVTPLVRATGYEAGLRTALARGISTTIALWRLDLASELVFSGDTGTTAPSYASRRSGLEWSAAWAPGDAYRLDADLALSRARYVQWDPTVISGPWVPGSIERVASVGARWMPGGTWSGGLWLRYVGPRPLVEDNTVRSHASSTLNAQIGRRIDSRIRVSVDLINLLNAHVNDVEYYYASQLKGEAAPVNDVHIHPAEPRTLRVTLQVRF